MKLQVLYSTEQPLGRALETTRQSQGQSGQLNAFLGPFMLLMGVLILIMGWKYGKIRDMLWLCVFMIGSGAWTLYQNYRNRSRFLAIHELGVECRSLKGTARFCFEEVCAWQFTQKPNQVTAHGVVGGLVSMADIGDTVTIIFLLRPPGSSVEPVRVEWTTMTTRTGKQLPVLESLTKRLGPVGVVSSQGA